MLEQPGLPLNSTKNYSFSWAFVWLLLGVFILSFAAIFTRLSENELGPAATSFNRYYIATIVLALWEGTQYRINNSSNPNKSIQLKDWGIFLLSSVLGTAAIFLCALS